MTEKYSSTIVTLFFSMHALHCIYLLRHENIIAIISVNSIEHNQSVPTIPISSQQYPNGNIKKLYLLLKKQF